MRGEGGALPPTTLIPRWHLSNRQPITHEPTGDSVVAPASAHVGSIRGAGGCWGRALHTPPLIPRWHLSNRQPITHEPTGDSVVAPASAHVGSIRGAGGCWGGVGARASTTHPTFDIPRKDGCRDVEPCGRARSPSRISACYGLVILIRYRLRFAWSYPRVLVKMKYEKQELHRIRLIRIRPTIT